MSVLQLPVVTLAVISSWDITAATTSASVRVSLDDVNTNGCKVSEGSSSGTALVAADDLTPTAGCKHTMQLNLVVGL